MKTIKKMVVLLFLAMAPAPAVEFSANDPAQVILDAADQPFVSLVNATVMIVQGASGVRLELSEERHVLWAAKLLRHLDVPGPC